MLSMMNNESRRAGWLSVEVIYQYDLRCFKFFLSPISPLPCYYCQSHTIGQSQKRYKVSKPSTKRLPKD